MEEDPWGWDIDRVVKELCTPERSWTSQIPSEDMPDAAELEEILREQRVKGVGLLSALDVGTMKEFGLGRFVHRQSLITIIKELQDQSVGYCEFMGRPPPKSNSSLNNQVGALPTDRKRPSEDSAAQGQSKKPRLDPENDLPAGPTVASSPANDLEYVENALAQQLSLNDELPQVLPDAEMSEQIPAVQEGEKRKRIAPTLIGPIDPSRLRDVSPAQETVLHHEDNVGISDTTNDTSVQNTGQKFDPILQPDLSSKASNENGQSESDFKERVIVRTKSRVDRRVTAHGGLGNKLPVDEIFYGKGLAGLPEEDEPGDFQLYGPPMPSRRRLYVNGLMKGFLRQTNPDRMPSFFRNGKSYSAIIPYPQELVPEHKERSFTLLHTSEDGVVHVSKEAVAKWPEVLNDGGIQTSQKAGHSGSSANATTADGFPVLSEFNVDYDAILAKYSNIPGGDAELPTFGESGSEGEYDYETWKEIEDEMKESTKGKLGQTESLPRGKPLDPEEVLATIDDCIEKLVCNWREKKLPKLAMRAWLTFRRYHGRGDLAVKRRKKVLRDEIKYLNEVRIPSQRKEIAEGLWTRAFQLQSQVMGSMEATIYTREQHLWERSVLKSETSPPRPAKQPAKAKKIPRTDLADGEELIGSGSESESEDDLDDFGDFIDDEEMEDLTAELGDDDSDDSGETDEETSKTVAKSPAKIVTPAAEPSSSSRDEDTNMLIEDVLVQNDSSEGDVQLTPHRGSSSSTPRLTLRVTPKKSATRSNIIDLTASFSDTPVARDSPVNDLRTPAKKESSVPSLGASSKRPRKSEDSPDPKKRFRESIDLVTPEKPRRDKTIIVKANGKSTAIVISSDSDKNRASPLSKRPVQPPSPESFPAYHEFRKIAAINYDAFRAVGDRDRLIIKYLCGLKTVVRDALLAEYKHAEESSMWTTFQDVLQAMHYNQEISNMESPLFETYVTVVRTFRRYVQCDRGVLLDQKKGGKYTEITKAVVHELETNKDLFSKLYKVVRDLAKAIEEDAAEDAEDTEDTEDEMPVARPSARVNPYAKDGSARPSGESSLSDDYESTNPLLASAQKKKRKLVENKEARELRESNKERIESQRKRRETLQSRLASQGMTTADDTSHIIINEGKLEDEGFVYVDETIGRRIKQHQISGVRFMWDQIVTDTKNKQGCLLAHTMGLGKTMQVITLLVAIANAKRSEDPSVSKQIGPHLVPNDLSYPRTLVLCPPGLVDNWEDELLTWAPQNTIGDPFKVTSTMQQSKRLEIIQDWHDDGGVLILGYDQFRIIIKNAPVKTRKAPFSEEEHEKLVKQLLEGPNIIIADEAHRLKNTKSQISEAASGFRSMSRIALTGSPLNNNIEEYHSMIEWVAPNYLGPANEFRAKYTVPIEEGLYVDSDRAQRRKSIKMLAVLTAELEMKVNRANMAVLRNDLPPKKEFVIRVTLTKLQREAYLIYVRHMRNASALHLVPRSKDGTLSQATLWSWLADLSLLCNHPSNFKKKIEEIGPSTAATTAATTDATTDGNSPPSLDDNDEEEESQLTTQGLIVKTGTKEKLMELLNSVKDIEAPELSNKMLLFNQILEECKRVGDKVLVFTQSIPTLDYLETACRNGGRQYLRLDGNTKMGSRQLLTKEFNSNSVEVFLISTQAGSLGLNLFAANRVIIFDFKYNPTQEEQAIGRAYRIGQEKPVFVYRFVASGTFEIQIENKAVFKMQLASRVVDKENPVAWSKKNTAAYLADPEDVDQEDLAPFRGEDVVLDKILDNKNSKSVIRSIMKTDTFADPDEDLLTAEDQREVEQMRVDARLKRDDPTAYEKQMRERSRKAEEQRVLRERAAAAESAEIQREKARQAAAAANQKLTTHVQKNPATAAGQSRPATSQSSSSQTPTGVRAPGQRNDAPGVSTAQKLIPQPGSKSSPIELPGRANSVERTLSLNPAKSPRISEARTQSASAKQVGPIAGAYTKQVSPITEVGPTSKQSTKASHAPTPTSAEKNGTATSVHDNGSEKAPTKSSEIQTADIQAQQSVPTEPPTVDVPAQQSVPTELPTAAVPAQQTVPTELPTSNVPAQQSVPAESISNMDGAADEVPKKTSEVPANRTEQRRSSSHISLRAISRPSSLSTDHNSEHLNSPSSASTTPVLGIANTKPATTRSSKPTRLPSWAHNNISRANTPGVRERRYSRAHSRASSRGPPSA